MGKKVARQQDIEVFLKILYVYIIFQIKNPVGFSPSAGLHIQGFGFTTLHEKEEEGGHSELKLLFDYSGCCTSMFC